MNDVVKSTLQELLEDCLKELIVLQSLYMYYDGFYPKERNLDKVIKELQEVIYNERKEQI